MRIAPTEVSSSDLATHRLLYGFGSDFRKSDWYQTFTMSDTQGDLPGLFAITDPKLHSSRRKLFSQQFSNTSILSREPIIRAKINMAVERFVDEVRVHGQADVMKWWTFMATDVIATLSFGESFGLLEQGSVSDMRFS